MQTDKLSYKKCINIKMFPGIQISLLTTSTPTFPKVVFSFLKNEL